MLTEKGMLPIGVEYDGQVHREFEMREQLAGDMIAVFDDESVMARATKNDAFLGLCILEKQITRIGSMPREAITHDTLLNMLHQDLIEVQRVGKILEEKRRSFRVDT